MEKRRIAVITGTRAEFGLLEPVLHAIERHSRLQFQLIVTGMHLLPKFGRTINTIRKSGLPIAATVRMQTGEDNPAAEAIAVGRGITGISRALTRLRSDMVVVLGDRIEAFAGAAAAATSRIPLAHLHGGDRATGQTDESLRGAITRLAHVHLAASEDARRRLIRSGESAWRVHKVGAPGLDDIPRARKARPAGAPDGRYAVIVQHPCSADARREARLMSAILSSVRAAGLAAAVIYPNSDPGHSGIISAIRRVEGIATWRLFKSLPRENYLELVRSAEVLVGNSSSGIIESASLGVNAVNIGPRQNGRLRCGANVIDVSADPAAILRGIRSALKRARPRTGRSVYGDGRAGERITKILARISIDETLLRKEMSY